MPFGPKEVDWAEITCLVDNAVDVLLPTTDVAKRPKIDDWFERPLIAEHGFSSAITLEANGKKRTLLLDSGLDPMVAVHNVDVLGFDLSKCEIVVSSHGHIDHAGGLLNIIKKTDPTRKVPLIIHPHAFRNRVMKFPDGRLLPLPAPKRELLRDAGYEITETSSPTLLMDDRVLVTGEVSRTNNFETGNPIHYAEVNGKMENDPLIKDDQAIVLMVKDKGLVVITGCGHSGIVNTLNYAKELTGEDKINAVMGGMHLSGGIFEPIIPRTVDELTTMRPALVIPCHCTGLKATNEMMRSMPDAFIQNTVGTTYTF